VRRAIRIGLKLARWLITLAVVGAVLMVLVLRSDWFHEKVRVRIVAELERATGGTATLGTFVFDWRLFTVRFEGLTLRGTEPAAAPALLEAKSIQVDLKLISFWKQQVDVQSVEVSEPKVNLMVAADGSTNIPAPKIHETSGKIGLEPVLDWKIAKFALENGVMSYAEKRVPLSAKGSNLRALLSYDKTGPRYKGQVSMQPLEMHWPRTAPIFADVYLMVGLEKNRIEISSAKFDTKDSHLEAAGAIENLTAPTGAFRFTALVAVKQAAAWLNIRGARGGMLDLSGSANYSSGLDYAVHASVKARDLDVEQDGVRITGVRATTTARLNPRGLALDGLTVEALGGRFKGAATLPELARWMGPRLTFGSAKRWRFSRRSSPRSSEPPGAASHRDRFTSTAD